MIKWNIQDIPDLSGKVVVVTGGNSGLGYETVRVSAMFDADIVMASRNPDRGRVAIEKITKKDKNAKISLMELDLSDLYSVERFANEFHDVFDRLDFLFNNAGVSLIPREYTVDGHEKHFGVNHLGHFALTGHLLSLICTTRNSRVITTSSPTYKQGYIDFDDLRMTNNYSRWGSYARSKVANIFFAYELQRLFERHNIDSKSVACQPGIVNTNITFQEDGPIKNKLLLKIVRIISFFTMPLFMQSASKGVLPQLMAAYDENVKGGSFYGPKYTVRGRPQEVASNEYTHNTEVAKRLWEISENLTGIHYDFTSGRNITEDQTGDPEKMSQDKLHHLHH